MGTPRRSVDLFVMPSRYQADVLISGGLPADRGRVLSNFTDVELWEYAPPRAISPEPYVVYSGRLSFEKGGSPYLPSGTRRSGTRSWRPFRSGDRSSVLEWEGSPTLSWMASHGCSCPQETSMHCPPQSPHWHETQTAWRGWVVRRASSWRPGTPERSTTTA